MLKETLLLGTRILASNFKRLSQPYKITFAITYRCNSRCKTCNIWKKRPSNELTLREIKELFKHTNPSWVNITGGEPFLREDLFDICKTIRKETSTFLVNLITNGLLPTHTLKTVKRLISLRFPKLIIGISLDGPRQLHDKLRGTPGNWKSAIALYKQLRMLNSSRFQTYLGYTISKYNVGEIGHTLQELKREIEGITINELHFNLFHKSDIYYSNTIKKAEASKAAMLKDIKYILSHKKSFGLVNIIDRRFIKLMPRYLSTKRTPLPCKALTSSCFVEPNGDVYPCTHFPVRLGNLRDVNHNLQIIWNSKLAKSVHENIEAGNCPHCWTACEAYQTMFGNLVKSIFI
ncbi:radical SAM protein [Candidatus Woesearchaeota archaeon]|nr:MAG: radical SAM protein [Candidatus Woesearchaeota archaeon]